MESQRGGDLPWEVRQRVCVEGNDAGGQQGKMVCMVNDIVEELLDLDMAPKLETLWWKSTHEDEDGATLKVGCGRSRWGSALHFGVRCSGMSLPSEREWH